MKDYFSGGSLSGFDYVPIKVGSVVGDKRYEIQSPPIMGKTKAVYRVRDLRLKRDSIFAHYWSKGEEAWHVRENEATCLSKLNHPSIVKLHDTGRTEQGMAYLIMEYVYGPPLALVMRHERRFEPDRAIEIFAQIANALSHLHKQGLIHGSVKANHIMIDQNAAQPDVVRLIDMAQTQQSGYPRAIINLSETFQRVGSPSPEELQGGVLDARSDIYALGCLLYKVLTGRAPFSGMSAEEIAQRHIEEPAQSLKEAHPQGIFSASLEACMARSLEKDPDKRIASADEFIAVLRGTSRTR